MRSEYHLDELDESAFGPEIKRKLSRQSCQQAGCDGELHWTSPARTLQMGQSVTLTGTCTQCGAQYEIEFRL